MVKVLQWVGILQGTLNFSFKLLRSRLAKLEPEADLEKAVNDMLIQEMDDILGFLGKAHYAPVRKVAMDELFSNKVPRIMGQLERLMKGIPIFNHQLKLCRGDFLSK